jgi:cytochrome o ubiquinol oxidase subunit IV
MKESSLYSYILGYVFSLALTAAPILLFFWHEHTGHAFPTHILMQIGFIIAAVLQLFVQLFFFLHLGREEKPRWNSVSMSFAVFVVVVIVFGSLWIMSHLQHAELNDLYPDGVVTPQNEG